MKEKKPYLQLFLVFLKIGAFTFGGGYAMIPLIQREIAQKRKWISDEEIFEVVAIAESTPGPIAVNSATFVGSRVGGFWGAFCATLGVIIPSFVIIAVISFVLDEFKNMKVVAFAFNGIRAGVLALIIKAMYSMYKQCPKGAAAYIIMGLTLILSAVFDINAIIIIIMCAAAGLIISAYNVRSEKK